MSQPASTDQRYVYYVVYRAISPTGQSWADGSNELHLDRPITEYAHVSDMAEAIRKNETAVSHMRITVTNWILLRVEPIEQPVGGQR